MSLFRQKVGCLALDLALHLGRCLPRRMLWTYVKNISLTGLGHFQKKAHFYTKGGDFRISIFGLLALAQPSIELIERLICKPKCLTRFLSLTVGFRNIQLVKAFSKGSLFWKRPSTLSNCL